MRNGVDRSLRLVIVSNNLRELREKMFPGHGGKKQVADAMGLTIQQWSPWEKGMRMPSDIRLEKIADFFGVSVEYILTEHRASPSESTVTGLQNHAPKVDFRTNAMLNNSVTATQPSIEVTNAVKEQLKSAMQLNNVMAILKLKFSVIDVEIVTIS